jgi:hypothetical protein
MIQLTPDESRVLGVLIEKALTTPDQYPLTLNAVINGANQKNNREPVTTMDDGQAFEALEGLRAKGLVIRADMAGSRVNKYRQQAGEAMRVRTAELAILAELLLRGPQTLGELRGRASRMHPFETTEAVKNMLNALGAAGSRVAPVARQQGGAIRAASLSGPSPAGCTRRIDFKHLPRGSAIGVIRETGSTGGGGFDAEGRACAPGTVPGRARSVQQPERPSEPRDCVERTRRRGVPRP